MIRSSKEINMQKSYMVTGLQKFFVIDNFGEEINKQAFKTVCSFF